MLAVLLLVLLLLLPLVSVAYLSALLLPSFFWAPSPSTVEGRMQGIPALAFRFALLYFLL